MTPLIRALADTPAASDPNAWWKQVAPGQRDWWQRRLNAIPFAGGNFQDNIFRTPTAPGTDDLAFDRMDIHPDAMRLR